MPADGYSIANSVTIKLDDKELAETGIAASNWPIGASLYIGGSIPTLDDNISDLTQLKDGTYLVKVIILGTVIYYGSIRVI